MSDPTLRHQRRYHIVKACPNCGFAPPRPLADEPTRDVAQVGSVAEAGYLVSLLEEAGLAAEARPHEAYDAVLGTWGAMYRVSVTEESVPHAARVLHAEATRNSASAPDAPTALEAPANPWRMLGVLAIVVAVGAVWAGQRAGARLQARVAPPNDRGAEPLAQLGAAVGPTAGQFIAEGRDGEPRRLLRFRGGEWVLSIDRDRDGRFESHRRFAAGPVGAANAR